MAYKFTKKPVTIEAVVWSGINDKEVMDFLGWRNATCDAKDGLRIHTLEGTHHAAPGDYIIKGVKGEFYPCKPDIFEMTYSPSTPPAASAQGFDAWLWQSKWSPNRTDPDHGYIECAQAAWEASQAASRAKLESADAEVARVTAEPTEREIDLAFKDATNWSPLKEGVRVALQYFIRRRSVLGAALAEPAKKGGK